MKLVNPVALFRTKVESHGLKAVLLNCPAVSTISLLVIALGMVVYGLLAGEPLLAISGGLGFIFAWIALLEPFVAFSVWLTTCIAVSAMYSCTDGKACRCEMQEKAASSSACPAPK